MKVRFQISQLIMKPFGKHLRKVFWENMTVNYLIITNISIVYSVYDVVQKAKILHVFVSYSSTVGYIFS